MPEREDDIDALLAEVTALADEAVCDLSSGSLAGEPANPSAAGDIPGQAGAMAGPPAARCVEHPKATPAAGRENTSRTLNLEVPVIVRLAESTRPLAEIVNLSTGAIIEFEKPSDSPLDLLINNKCIGHGLAVKVGENFGLRVTNVGSVRDRMQALGGG